MPRESWDFNVQRFPGKTGTALPKWPESPGLLHVFKDFDERRQRHPSLFRLFLEPVRSAGSVQPENPESSELSGHAAHAGDQLHLRIARRTREKVPEPRCRQQDPGRVADRGRATLSEWNSDHLEH